MRMMIRECQYWHWKWYILKLSSEPNQIPSPSHSTIHPRRNSNWLINSPRSWPVTVAPLGVNGSYQGCNYAHRGGMRGKRTHFDSPFATFIKFDSRINENWLVGRGVCVCLWKLIYSPTLLVDSGHRICVESSENKLINQNHTAHTCVHLHLSQEGTSRIPGSWNSIWFPPAGRLLPTSARL